jgi:hypothetical protein
MKMDFSFALGYKWLWIDSNNQTIVINNNQLFFNPLSLRRPGLYKGITAQISMSIRITPNKNK